MNEQGDSVTFVSMMVTYVPTNTYEDRARNIYIRIVGCIWLKGRGQMLESIR